MHNKLKNIYEYTQIYTYTSVLCNISMYKVHDICIKPLLTKVRGIQAGGIELRDGLW